MKDHDIDTKIVVANPHNDSTKFVQQTMRTVRESTPKRRHWMSRLFHMSKPAVALASFVAVVIVGSAVYATAHFAPAFVQITDKETNHRGAVEYQVNDFAKCTNRGHTPTTERFEIKKDAPPMSDEEAHKIIQAACELKWLENFPKTVWQDRNPPSAEWTESDVLVYTRIDTIGVAKNISETEVAVTTPYGQERSYQAPQNETIKAFSGGEEVSLDTIKPSDTVYAIVRMNETARNWIRALNKTLSPSQPPEQPTLAGIVGLVKLSLPLDYYHEKQRYVTPILSCYGNEGELCPDTPSIDVYPRTANHYPITNPYKQEFADSIHRQISGKVIELSDDSLVLESRKGNRYTVTVGDAGFKVYNRDYTRAYTGMDAQLKVGSTVMVRYNQPKDADTTQVAKEHIVAVNLQLDAVNAKTDNLKQY